MNTTTVSQDIWVEALENPDAVRHLYDAPPKIIELFEMRFHRNGPALDLVGLLDRFPDRPPPRWIRAQSNTALVTVELYGLKAISVDSWSTSNQGILTLERLDHHDLRATFAVDGKPSVLCGAMLARIKEFRHYLVAGE